ncbi:hypothetical protein [Streptomyces sp. NPDC089919]|uniref:hypothetical protein n=1 Tax=Streptomyces sp. NPDC089919 TaxID=3155188 RepID=UPI0034387169
MRGADGGAARGTRRPRRGRAALALAGLLGVLGQVLAGCGIDAEGPVPAGPAASGLPGQENGPADAVHLYFSSPVGLERVSRTYRGPDPLGAALARLVTGPDEAERTRGLVTFLPPAAPAPFAVARGREAVDVYLPRGWTADRTAGRQLVCTAADAVARGAAPGSVQVRLHHSDGRSTTAVCASP